MLKHNDYMRRAILVAESNPTNPFGTVIVNSNTGNIISEGWNQADTDPTLHGEIDAIRKAAAIRRETPWSSLTLYTTAEPCPMCQSAILWAGIERVVYGTSISTLQELGWNQIDLTANEVIQRAGFVHCEVVGGILESRCDRLFKKAKRVAKS